MNESEETFEQALGYMAAHESGGAEEAFFDRVAWRELIMRLRAAHERSMVQTAERIALNTAAKFESMEKTVATLRAALNPVLECNPSMWGADYKATKAINEAKRIYNEGGAK